MVHYSTQTTAAAVPYSKSLIDIIFIIAQSGGPFHEKKIVVKNIFFTDF
jgi:hypothetical protein